MPALKSEYQYQKNKGSIPSIRTLLMGHIDALHKWGGRIPKVFNALSNGFMGRLGQQWLGIHPSRSLPNVSSLNLRKWYKTQSPLVESKHPNAEIYLFVDEFTEHLDAEVGQQALAVFWKLGIRVHWPRHASSGRAQISKGLLDTARKKAEKNIKTFSPLVNEKIPLVGLEPSALLSFRDEYPKITRGNLSAKAKELAKNAMTFEEFMAQYISADLLDSSLFSDKPVKGKIHGHCHQKSLSQIHLSQKIINALPGVESTIIPSGCCGMAGSFGYEEEHFEVSQKVGELVLFPAARKMGVDQFLIAAGTSCRHQIADGVNRTAMHPASFYHLRLR
jgi:Fe-S oxidoreductase